MIDYVVYMNPYAEITLAGGGRVPLEHLKYAIHITATFILLYKSSSNTTKILRLDFEFKEQP